MELMDIMFHSTSRASKLSMGSGGRYLQMTSSHRRIVDLKHSLATQSYSPWLVAYHVCPLEQVAHRAASMPCGLCPPHKSIPSSFPQGKWATVFPRSPLAGSRAEAVTLLFETCNREKKARGVEKRSLWANLTASVAQGCELEVHHICLESWVLMPDCYLRRADLITGCTHTDGVVFEGAPLIQVAAHTHTHTHTAVLSWKHAANVKSHAKLLLQHGNPWLRFLVRKSIGSGSEMPEGTEQHVSSYTGAKHQARAVLF